MTHSLAKELFTTGKSETVTLSVCNVPVLLNLKLYYNVWSVSALQFVHCIFSFIDLVIWF